MGDIGGRLRLGRRGKLSLKKEANRKVDVHVGSPCQRERRRVEAAIYCAEARNRKAREKHQEGNTKCDDGWNLKGGGYWGLGSRRRHPNERGKATPPGWRLKGESERQGLQRQGLA